MSSVGPPELPDIPGCAVQAACLESLGGAALAWCVADPVQLDRIIDPALCHGWAGVLATVWCAAADARSPDLRGHLPRGP